MSMIISASVTPFSEDNRLDLDSAARLYEFGIRQGLDGFFILGNMGEWPLLNRTEKDDLARCACEIIGNRARILLGISDTGMSGILDSMERWSSLPHTHWTLLFPSGAGAPQCPVEFMHQIGDAADRPVFLYYAPQVNGVTVTTEEFKDILSHPRVAGVKNSAATMRARKELLFLKRTLHFELLEGEEWSIDEALAAGCDGAIAGFGAVGAKLMRVIADQVEAGDLAAARESQFALIDIFHRVYGPNARWANVGQKYALVHLGILSSCRTRSLSQQPMPESHAACVRACIDQYHDTLL